MLPFTMLKLIRFPHHEVTVNDEQCYHIPDMAKVRPAGRMRPSKDFLRPLEQTATMQYHAYGHHFVRKTP